jgi:hypothetical protein
MHIKYQNRQRRWTYTSLRLFLFWSRKQRGATATKQGGEEMADLKRKKGI